MPPIDPTGIGAFPTALLSKARVWGPVHSEEQSARSRSSMGDNDDLSYLVDEATSWVVGDEERTFS